MYKNLFHYLYSFLTVRLVFRQLLRRTLEAADRQGLPDACLALGR